jgi:hypothetical protein
MVFHFQYPLSIDQKNITSTYKAPTLLVTAHVPIPPLRKWTALGSLLIPARTTSSHVGACRVPFLGLQVGEETTARAGAGATSFAEAWDIWGGI